MIGSDKAKSQEKETGLDYADNIRLEFLMDSLHCQLDGLESPGRHAPGVSVTVFPGRFI